MKSQGTKAQELKLEGVLLPGFTTGNHRHRQPDLQGIAVGNSVGYGAGIWIFRNYVFSYYQAPGNI